MTSTTKLMTRSSVAAQTDTLTSSTASSQIDETVPQGTSSMNTRKWVSEVATSKQESGASRMDKTGMPSTRSPSTGKSVREAANAKHEYIFYLKLRFKTGFDMLVFVFLVKYMKHPNFMCKPNEAMISTSLNDAKLECSANPNCQMFFHDVSMSYNFTFAACQSTASIRICTKGNIVFTSGNTNRFIR